MKDYQRAFIQFAIENHALLFGSFTLKSGRTSPYFFNSGLFNTGETLAKLGEFYAQAIIHANIEYDMLFGPAYKGIPLVSTVAIALARVHNRNVPYCFDRKEVKDHGEGGLWVGAPLHGRILIVDDVISAGVTAYNMINKIQSIANTEVSGIAITLDRQERNQDGHTQLSTTASLRKNYHIPIANIIALNDIIEYLSEQPGEDNKKSLALMHDYQEKYGGSFS